MTIHNFNVAIGDQVYVGSQDEEIGAVLRIEHDHLVIYIENSGEFRIDGPKSRDGEGVLHPEAYYTLNYLAK